MVKAEQLPRFFSREAGGAGAIIGIVWLVPIFGIYFATRLNQAGHGPTSRGRAIGFALAALVVEFVLIFAMFKLSMPIVATIVLSNLVSFLSLWIGYRGWPELGKVEVYPIPFNRTTPLASTIQFCGMPDTLSVSHT
ncbi:MAG: hypothetical protein DMG06_30045 [Acidobacteria bacterium]|nr:MAG: hypothetical protein DMG06_30045 [Acidobacteriota bacterium]